MSSLLLGLLVFCSFLTIYNVALLLSLRSKHATMKAREEYLTEILLRIRLGVVKRKNKL